MAPRRIPPWIGSSKWWMLMTQTTTQMTPISLLSCSPNSSICTLRGVFSSSCSVIDREIFPIAVSRPVAVTTARPLPRETRVPENIMLTLSWLTMVSSSSSASPTTLDGPPKMRSTDLRTASLSPVSTDWSTVMTELWITTRRQSAGTMSPTRSVIRSPGTSSEAGMYRSSPSRRTRAFEASYSLSSWIAFSAFDSCATATMAFAMRISRMTSGSTNAVIMSFSSSKSARTNETTAAASRMSTSVSSNCLTTSL
mmetsp:Transcript_5246/g.14980  ORF Transcript_5246/g.14980 Transcript_5246/m.14980 type:complete len:254 (+) Transcript_5246:790-1551(+)